MPKHLHDYQVALWDEVHRNIILVMKGEHADKKARAAIYINTQESKRGELVNHTASLDIVIEKDIKDRKLEIIDGAWK